MINTASDCLLLGDPVGHSLSPLIHNSASKELGLAIQYRAVQVKTGELESSVSSINGTSILGANVTIPHKQAVVPFLDTLTDVARMVGAVNTIYVQNGLRIGHNTDVEGFVAPLNVSDFFGKDVVVLGAGGAARAVMVAAQTQLKARRISLVSRSLDKARAVCADLNIGEPHEYSSLTSLLTTASLIVNATPLGMSPKTGESPLPLDTVFHSDQTVYDLIYSPEETMLLRHARKNGAQTVGGLPMLVAQAAGSFKIWTGVEMPVKTVASALRKHLEAR